MHRHFQGRKQAPASTPEVESRSWDENGEIALILHLYKLSLPYQRNAGEKWNRSRTQLEQGQWTVTVGCGPCVGTWYLRAVSSLSCCCSVMEALYVRNTLAVKPSMRSWRCLFKIAVWTR